jgi:hypothetical protein
MAPARPSAAQAHGSCKWRPSRRLAHLHLPTPTPVPSPTVSLAWNANTGPSNLNSNVVGYQLHTGFSSGNYTQTTDLGNTTAVTVPLTQSGWTYFFIVTAYNAAGTQSIVSNQISAVAP